MSAQDRVAEPQHALDELLREQDGLLIALDRVIALRGTAHRIREAAGASAGFVAEVTGPGVAVIRWLDGNRTDALADLTVPVGQGLGGATMAAGRPMRVSDYVSAPSITHEFDSLVRAEGLGGMLAVPVLDRTCSRERVVAIAYVALRRMGTFGDDAVRAVERVAAEAARALHVAGLAEAGRHTAVAAERQRMQAALHDSVGAMLFSIGAQVRDLSATLAGNPVLRGRLSRLEEDVSAAAVALRESMLALAESSPERALPVELAELCRSFEARTGVSARFVQLSAVRPVDAERTAVLSAAVREGLLNVEKHARATAVVVSLGATERGPSVAVVDDGCGDGEPAAAEGAGIGVRALAERAARVGGAVSLVRDEDGGTTLRAWVPDLGGGAAAG